MKDPRVHIMLPIISTYNGGLKCPECLGHIQCKILDAERALLGHLLPYAKDFANLSNYWGSMEDKCSRFAEGIPMRRHGGIHGSYTGEDNKTLLRIPERTMCSCRLLYDNVELLPDRFRVKWTHDTYDCDQYGKVKVFCKNQLIRPVAAYTIFL